MGAKWLEHPAHLALFRQLSQVESCFETSEASKISFKGRFSPWNPFEFNMAIFPRFFLEVQLLFNARRRYVRS